MKEFELEPVYDPLFVGREHQFRELTAILMDSFGSLIPIQINGLAGAGKTSLIQQFFALNRNLPAIFWLDTDDGKSAGDVIDAFLKRLYAEKDPSDFFVVFDGSDSLSDQEILELNNGIFNVRARSSFIFTQRKIRSSISTTGVVLPGLPQAEARALAMKRIDYEIDSSSLDAALNLVEGHPLAISLLSEIFWNKNISAIQDILSGKLYEFTNQIALPKKEIISTVRPKIVSATDHLILKLKRQPESIYDISPRKFEELLAELLTDLGWEVELTKATGDGGKDILAYLDTDIGKILCLVEAKRYREDRKIGVDLVRSLFGTLYDHRASSAMLITTSSFTAGAKEFQRKYQYQLSLRDYGGIVQWIQNYKNIGL